MNSSPLVCVLGNQCTKVCMNEQCPHPSPLCQTITCQCNTRHNICMSISPMSILYQNMNQKIQSYTPIDELLISKYDQIIKMVSMEKQECIQIISQQTILKNDQKKLWQLMKSGASNDITPLLVSNVVKSLSAQLKINTALLQQRLRLDSQKQLNFLRQFWGRQNPKTVSNEVQITRQIRKKSKSLSLSLSIFRFDMQMHHPNFDVFDRFSSIKLTKTCQSYVTALISPSIPQLPIDSKRVSLKIINKPSYFYIGMGSQKAITTSQYKWEKDNGMYLIASNGYTINSYYPQQNRQTTNFRFSNGDIVDIQYIQQDRILRFSNKSRKVDLKVKKEEDSEFYFCLCAFSVNTEVEIAKQVDL